MTTTPHEKQAKENTMRTVTEDLSVIRSAFANFPSGVAALCAEIDGERTGLVASTFTVGVSLEPALVLFSVQNESQTWPVLREASRIGISILAQNHDAICRQIASRTGDRFAGLDTWTTDEGALFVEGSSLWLDCELVSETPAGDHHVVILEVKALKVEDDMEPLIFHRSSFRQLAGAC